MNSSGTVLEERQRYQVKDHLGSVSLITDEIGLVEQVHYFDPWGQARQISVSGSSKSFVRAEPFRLSLKPVTTRGFTGHEQLDETGLIHMNGRVYDARLGRFIQADPLIQDPTKVQSLNRYSYVWNNPLNATDPSGFVCEGQGCMDTRPEDNKPIERIVVRGTQPDSAMQRHHEAMQRHLQNMVMEGISHNAMSGIAVGATGNSEEEKSSGRDEGIITVNCNAQCQEDAKAKGNRSEANVWPVMLLGYRVGSVSVSPWLASFARTSPLAVAMIIPGDTPRYVSMEGASESATGGPMPDPDDDEYENPGHHDPFSQGPNNYNNTKSVLPRNHLELWKASRRASDGNRWTKVGNGKNAVYHRFQNDGNGKWHWNGSTNGVTRSGQPRTIKMNNIPRDVQRW